MSLSSLLLMMALTLRDSQHQSIKALMCLSTVVAVVGGVVGGVVDAAERVEIVVAYAPMSAIERTAAAE